MFEIKLTINGQQFDSVSDASFADLYRAAHSLVRFGVRHHVQVRAIIQRTGCFRSVWLYSRQIDDSEKWIARVLDGAVIKIA